MDFKSRKTVIVLASLTVLLVLFMPSFREPVQESDAEHFDVIIVLGNPATAEGLPGETMAQRVTKGVELFQQGVAPYMIFTGGAVANEYVESDVERQLAIELGVPKDNIFTEGLSTSTYENAFWAVDVMKRCGFNSAAIVSSNYHLKRANGIFSNYDVEFKTFGSGNPSSFGQYLHDIIREHMILCCHTIIGYPREFMIKNAS